MIIGDIYERNAAFYGSSPAVYFEERTLTHSELLERAYRLGNALCRIGASKQDRVMMLAENCVEILELNAACSITGMISVTLNYRLSAAEQLHIVKDAAARIWIYDAKYHDRVMQVCAQLEQSPRLICIGASPREGILDYENLISGSPANHPPLRATETDILFLVYTSGTTGHPKGVMQAQAAQVEQARITSNACGSNPSDRLLAVMPYYHAGVNNIYLAYAWAGAAVVLQRSFDVEQVYSRLETHKITAALLAPVMIQMLLEAPEHLRSKPHCLRTIIYSSAPMPVPLLKRAIGHFGPIFNQAYGMTECMVGTFMYAHQHKPDGSEQDLKRLASAGQPYFGSKISIRRDDGSACQRGEAGEICLDSPALMHGYWNNTAATLNVIREGWYHTGDMGYLDDDNYLFVVDRKKDMIISGGENIYSREVEEALLKHPAVYEAAVVGMPDPKWGESVMAFIVCQADKPTAKALIEHCRKEIASYKKPRHIAFVDALPRVPSTNKIDKKQLREPHWLNRREKP